MTMGSEAVASCSSLPHRNLLKWGQATLKERKDACWGPGFISKSFPKRMRRRAQYRVMHSELSTIRLPPRAAGCTSRDGVITKDVTSVSI